MRTFFCCLSLLLLVACKNSAEKKASTPDTVATDLPLPPPSGDTIFRGHGTEPFWSIDVIRNRGIIFSSADGPSVEVPYVMPVTNDSLTRYTSSNDSTTLELAITKRNCSDGMSDNIYSYAIAVSVNAIRYEGCGVADGKAQ